MEFLFSFFFCLTADNEMPHNDDIAVETRTAPVQSVVMMECRTDLRQPVKYTWSRQGGILPKSARVEGVRILYNHHFNIFIITIDLIKYFVRFSVEIVDSRSESRRRWNLCLHGP